MRKAVLPPPRPSSEEEAVFRQCTKCGRRTTTAGPMATKGVAELEQQQHQIVPAGKWAAFEMGWEVRCACGGLWIAVS